MDEKVLAVLAYLHPLGIGKKTDISNMINGFFPIGKEIQDYEFNIAIGDIVRFIKALEPFLEFDKSMNYTNAFRDHSNVFVNRFPAAINTDGIYAYDYELDRRQKRHLNESAIGTNESIKATNESVRITNEALLNVSKEQGVINTGIIDNSKQQIQILRRQTLIFLFTGVFTLGTLIISVFTLYRDSSKEVLIIQLQKQSKEIESLKLKLSLTHNKDSHAAKGMKIDSTNH